MYRIQVTNPNGVDEIDEEFEGDRQQVMEAVEQYMVDYGEPHGCTIAVTPLI